MRQVNWGRRRAPIDGREPTGVAMGQHVDALARLLGRRDLFHQRKAMFADTPVDGDVFLGNLGGAGIGDRGTIR